MLQVWYFTIFFLEFKSNMLVQIFCFLLKATFAVAVLDVSASVHLALFVIMLPK